MKLSSIKTQDEFYLFADNWYQRAHKLRMCWQDEKTPNHKRYKALFLWREMVERVMGLTQIAIKLSYYKPKNPN